MAAKSPEKGSLIKPFVNILEGSIGETWNFGAFLHHRESFFRGVLPNKRVLNAPCTTISDIPMKVVPNPFE